MQVQVRLYATFRNGRFNEQVRDYPAGTCIGKVLEELAIDESQVGTLFLDHKYAARDHTLHEGAKLGIFPLVGGG
jgi:molybdopterin synthase sulfur carrier subunit